MLVLSRIVLGRKSWLLTSTHLYRIALLFSVGSGSGGQTHPSRTSEESRVRQDHRARNGRDVPNSETASDADLPTGRPRTPLSHGLITIVRVQLL